MSALGLDLSTPCSCIVAPSHSIQFMVRIVLSQLFLSALKVNIWSAGLFYKFKPSIAGVLAMHFVSTANYPGM